MPFPWLIFLWHLGMVVLYFVMFCLNYRVTSSDEFKNVVMELDRKLGSKTPELGGRFKYLTHINAWLVQFGFFIMQMLADLCPGLLKEQCSPPWRFPQQCLLW